MHTPRDEMIIVALKVVAVILLWLAGVVAVCWWMDNK